MSFKSLLFLSFFLVSSSLMAQVKVPFKVKTLNKATQKKEAGVTVKVYDGATLVNTYTSDGSGEVNLMLDGGKKYKIEVSKSGKVSRNFAINLKNVDDELIQGANAPKGEIDMSLFDQVPNVDYSYVTSNVATEFYFDPTQSQNLLYDDVLAGKMVAKVDKILKEAEAQLKKGDANYNSLIKQADALYTSKKYEEAKGVYEQALLIKQTEKHPNDRLIEIEGILNAQKASNQANAQLEEEYKNLIAAGDALKNQKKYEDAISKYQEALKKKPEQYAKDQIEILEAAIEADKKAAENAGKYSEAMRMGDVFFKQSSWDAAKKQYTDALKYKAGDPVAKAKLDEIDKKLNDQKAQQDKKKQYDDAVAAGEALMGQEKWAEAKVKFNEALTIESAATYPKEKIKEADAKLAEIEKEKAKKEQISKLLAEGNSALTAKQTANAKTKFEQVLTLEANHPEATAKLAEIAKLLADEKANAEKIAKAKQLVIEGDALAKTNKNAEAKAKYQESIALVPDQLVQAKIDAIDLKLSDEAKKAEQKAKIDQLISDGDAAMAGNNFPTAKQKFEEVLTLDAANAIAKAKLTEVQKKMAAADAEADKAKKYQEAYAAGLTALASKDYTGAKEKFLAAIAIDNTKQEAKDKLAEVQKIIDENAASIAKQEKYNAAIKAGTDLMSAGKLTEAKSKFEEAKTLDPTQTLPTSKITEIEALLAKAEKDKKVTQLLTEGANLLAKKDLANAKLKYNEVLTIDNSNKTASEKLVEIAKLENDMAGEAEKEKRFQELKTAGAGLVASQSWAQAKQKYLEAKSIKSDTDVENALKTIDLKLAEQLKNEGTEKQYSALVTEAQNLESAKNYDAAITKYKEALNIKDAPEPKERIKALTELKNANSEQEKLTQVYNDAILKGDGFVASKDYPAAIKAYEEAKKAKPTETLPDLKIKEVEKLVKDAQATDADIQYQKIISAGQKAMDEKNWSKAKEMYNRALTFRSDDELPKKKLQEIDSILKKEKEDAEKLAAYQKKMSEAQDLVNKSKFEDAIVAYQQAKSIKSDEVLPDQKIAELQAKLKPTTDPNVELKEKFNQAMQRGQAAESVKNYKAALTEYQAALNLIPKDAIATSKVSEMKQILDDLAKNDAKEKQHQELLKSADDLFNNKQWLDAKNAYDNVLKNFPDDSYAKTRMEASIKNSENEAFLKEYEKLISKADEKFNDKDYDRAKELYNRAIKLNAPDPYPKQKLKEIEDILNPKTTTAKAPTNGQGEQLVLEELGTQVDNTVDGKTRLQNANDTRKGRIATRFFKRNQETKDKTGELADVQKERADVSSQKLDSIKVQENQYNEIEEEKHQNNITVVKEKQTNITEETAKSNEIKSLNIAEQKSQLNAANQTVEDVNSTMGTSADENNETIIKTKSTLNEADKAKDDKKSSEISENDKKLTSVKIEQENNTTDDFNERKKEEEKVKVVNENIEDYHKTENDKDKEQSGEVKLVITNYENDVKVKRDDEVKQSPLNNEKILAIDSDHQAQQKQDAEEKYESSKAIENKIRSDEQTALVYGENRKDEQQKSSKVIEHTRADINENNRQDFNENYEKNVANKELLVKELSVVDQYQQLPSIAAENNKQAHNVITQTHTESTEQKSDEHAAKTVNNKNQITNINQEVTDKNSIDDKKANENADAIKNTKSELGTLEKIQADSQKEKTQESNAKLTEIKNKEREVINTGKYDVDLTKYKEGVNQETFENYDKEGLLINIITRRVVVRNGKGDVYVKTQTIDTATYTKNGQPCTEQTWIKETQDAKLIKNY